MAALQGKNKSENERHPTTTSEFRVCLSHLGEKLDRIEKKIGIAGRQLAVLLLLFDRMQSESRGCFQSLF